MDLPEIPEWEGEPTELFGQPPSHEASEPLTLATGYHLWHVLEQAAEWDPDLQEQLATL